MIRNFLRDGTEVKEITGHVVPLKQCRAAYAAMEKGNENNRKGVSDSGGHTDSDMRECA